MKFFSIQNKLLFLVLIISLASILATTVLALNLADSIIKSNAEQALTDEANARGSAISSIVERRVNAVEHLAEDPQLQELFSEIIPQLDEATINSMLNENSGTISSMVESFRINEFPASVKDLKIINSRGISFFSLNEEVLTRQPKLKLQDTKVEFIQDKEMNRILKITTPVFSSTGLNQGVIVVTSPTSVFDDILLNRFNLHETGEVYLVNSDHTMISESLFLENAAFNQKVNSEPVRLCFDEGRNVEGLVYPDYRNIDIFGVSYCERDLGFVLLTEVDESAILEPVYDLQQKIMIVGLSIMGAATITTYILSKRLSKPIIKLRNAAEAISKGEFGTRSKINTNDEIGELSSAFDNMARTIQETISAITKRENIIKRQENLLLKFSEEKQDCCVCLVDMVGGKEISSSLTKPQSKHYNEIFSDSILPIIEKHRGIPVKMLDDAILFYFKATDSSVFSSVLDCCIEISNESNEINKKLEDENLPGMSYRISATFGTVNVTKTESDAVQDVFGEPVNHCFKINPYALPNTVIIDQSMYDKVKDSDYKFTQLDESIIKGLIYRIFLVEQN